MRGNPLQRLLVVIAAFIAMGVAVGVVLRPSADLPASAPANPVPNAPQTFKIQVDFVQAPAQFHVLHLGKTILEGKGPQLNFSTEAQLAMPREGIELVLEATWPKGAPQSVVRLQCETGGERITDRTFWGRGDITQIILVR